MPRQLSARRLTTSTNGIRCRRSTTASLDLSDLPDRDTPLTHRPGGLDQGAPSSQALSQSPSSQLTQPAHFSVFSRPSPARITDLLPQATLLASPPGILGKLRRSPNLLPPKALFPLFGQPKTVLSPLAISPNSEAALSALPLQSSPRFTSLPLPSDATTPSPLMDPPPDTAVLLKSAPLASSPLVMTPVYILLIDNLDISQSRN